MTRPTRSYLVCATPRSGSTLLCDLLDQTGVAGHPDEYFEALRHSGVPRQPHEYFDPDRHVNIVERLAFREMPDRAPEPSELWQPETYDRYLRWALEEGTTPNGVFGAKLMWTHLLDVAERLDRPADPALLEERLPELRYVHVTRGDKVAQAVSLWRAVQTRAWRSGSKYSCGRRGTPEWRSASKYSSGWPARPVWSRRWHRSVLPLRGVAQTRYEREGSATWITLHD